MDLCNELIYKELGKYVMNRLELVNFNYERLILNSSICALNEIRSIIQNSELDDFQIVDEIVTIFEHYSIDTNAQHDFG